MLILAAGVGAALLLLPVMRSGQIPKGDDVMRLVLGSFFALITVWFLKGVIFSTPDTTVVKAQGKLKLVKAVRRSGNVSDSELSRRNIVYHEMIVGGQTFGVTPDIFNRVLAERTGETYAVYFTEKTKSLLSLEHISPAQG